MAHPGAVTGKGCAICDGPCKEPWLLPDIHAGYPFLPKEMVDAMQPPEPQPTPAPEPRAKRLAEDRARKLAETTSRQPSEDRSE